jgi:hypothetical protein
VLTLYGFCGLASIGGLTLTATQLPYRGLVVIIAFVVACVGVQRLGYAELDFAERVAFGGRIQKRMKAQISVKRFEEELLESKTLEDAWHVLCKASPDFGFSGIEWKIDGEVRIRRTGSGRHTRLDFPGRGYIVLTRATKSQTAASSGALFADCVGRVFFDRLNELSPSGSNRAIYASAD